MENQSEMNSSQGAISHQALPGTTWFIVDGPPKRDASLIFIGPKNYPSPRKKQKKMYIYIYTYVDYVKRIYVRFQPKKKAMKHETCHSLVFASPKSSYSLRLQQLFLTLPQNPRGLWLWPHGVPVLTEEGSQGWPNRLHGAGWCMSPPLTVLTVTSRLTACCIFKDQVKIPTAQKTCI